MNSFYQSGLWKYINKEIYKKPIFEADVLGKTYRGVVKKQRRLGKEFRWYMIHGIFAKEYDSFSENLQIAFDRLQRDHSNAWSDILLQVGLVDEFDVSPTEKVKNDKYAEKLKKKREEYREHFKDWYGLVPTWREHMPEATVILDTKEKFDKSTLSSSGRRSYNKGEKADLDFVVLKKKEQWEQYRESRYSMSYDKGFNIIDKKTFMELMHYLHKEDKGVMFAAMKDGEIVSGVIYLFYGKQLVYLYGMTDRSFGNIGGQYWLTAKIMQWAHENDWKSIDLLGVAPVGMEEGHSLAGVTRFKQSFGGKTHSYVGNYDIVFNNLLYQIIKRLK